MSVLVVANNTAASDAVRIRDKLSTLLDEINGYQNTHTARVMLGLSCDGVTGLWTLHDFKVLQELDLKSGMQ